MKVFFRFRNGSSNDVVCFAALGRRRVCADADLLLFFFVDTSLPDGSSRFEPGWSGFHRPVPGFIDIELAPSLIEFYWVYRVKLCFT